MDLENNIRTKQNTEQELRSAIKALTLDIEKCNENCKQLEKKGSKTQERIDDDNRNFRERYDEINNEITRCSKTNKQAMNDLMDTKNDISDMLNRKREVDRKIEEENKKFREIELELSRKTTELNRNIAEKQERKHNLEFDKADGLSLKNITDKSRALGIAVDEMSSKVETLVSQVEKTTKQIVT